MSMMSSLERALYSLIAATGLLAIGLPQPVDATVILNDGGDHTISTVSQDLAVSDSTQVTVVSGGVVNSNSGGVAVSFSGSPGSLTVSGSGQVNGRIQNRSPSSGWTINLTENARVDGAVSSSELDTLNISGNALLAGGVIGMRFLNISENATILNGIAQSGGSTFTLHMNMSGGTVMGSDSASNGRAAVDAGPELNLLTMTGGLLAGGNGGNAGGNALSCNAGCQLDIRGGVLDAGNGGNYGGHALAGDIFQSAQISGGTFLGGNGGLVGGDALHLRTDLASIHVAISGGVFDAGFGGIDDGWLLNTHRGVYEIEGGQFGYFNTGRGFGIWDSTINLYGWDLTFLDGLVSGYLLDGSWISSPVYLNSETSFLNVFNVGPRSVPEPGTLVLLALGLLGVAATRRTSRVS